MEPVNSTFLLKLYPMQIFFRRAILLLLFMAIGIALFAQTDSSSVSVNIYSSAFFDNKEFTGDIKKGYTNPGFFVQPTLRYGMSQFNLNAGFHLLYLAGADSLAQFVPYLSLACNLTESVTMTVGSLKSRDNRSLPDALFKYERSYMNQPELGVEFNLTKPRLEGDLWINWERYIAKASPFQEEFTVGFVGRYRPSTFEQKHGFYVSALALTTHQGGQIDSSNLPVTTLTNMGFTTGHRFNLMSGATLAGVELSGYWSSDKSPTPHIKYRDGFALHPRIMLEWPVVRLDLGYWYANKFVNPRGEELYGSVSTISEAFDASTRELITLQFLFHKTLHRQFVVSTGFNAYIDIRSGLTEYSYVFRMTFDGCVYKKR